jgi:hypothetical protein
MSTVRRRIVPLRIIAALALAVAPLFGLARPSLPGASVVAAPLAAPAGLHAAIVGHTPADYRQEAQSLAAKIAGFLGRPLGIPITITVNKIEEHPPALMYAFGLDAQGGLTGTPAQCRIGVNPSGDALQGRDWAVDVAHEVWHCYQAVLLGLPRFGQAATDAQVKWIMEGQAQWVGEMVAGPDIPEARSWWFAYLTDPQMPLFTRTYDALGFYAHIAERCGGPPHVWSVLQGMLDKVPDNPAAYRAATVGCDAGFLDTWASGFFREPDRGSAWNTSGPAMPTGDTRAAALRGHVIALANGQVIPESIGPYANGIYELTSNADIVKVAAAGYVRLSDAANFDYIVAGATTYCTRAGGCTCPPGSVYQGPSLTPLVTPADLALTGGTVPSGTSVRLTGISLDEFCMRPPPRIAYRPGGPLPNPCQLVTMSDVQQIIGRNPQYVYQTLGPLGNRSAPGCEHIVVATGFKAPGSDSGAVAIFVQQRSRKKYLGPGKAIARLGDEAHLLLPDASGDAILAVGKGHLTITIEVTFGARSTRIALAVARIALSRL